jgi:hypothetical protein
MIAAANGRSAACQCPETPVTMWAQGAVNACQNRVAIGGKGDRLQPLRNTFSGRFDKRLAQRPKAIEERSPLCVGFNDLEVIKTFRRELHAGDLHQFGKFTHGLDIDTDARMRYGDGDQFSAVTNAEMQLPCNRPVAPGVEHGLPTFVPDQGYILCGAIKALTQQYPYDRARCRNTPLVPEIAQTQDLLPVGFSKQGKQ